jgi:hypothetical protein
MFSHWNRKAVLAAGLLAGAAQVVAGVLMYVSGVYFARWSILVSIAVLLTGIVAGTRWYARRSPAEEITYAKALGLGIAISVSTGFVYAIYNMVSISFFYPHFVDEIIQARVARAVAQGQSPESLAAMRAQVTATGIAISNFVRLSVVGSFLSLLCALLTKRPPER